MAYQWRLSKQCLCFQKHMLHLLYWVRSYQKFHYYWHLLH